MTGRQNNPLKIAISTDGSGNMNVYILIPETISIKSE